MKVPKHITHQMPTWTEALSFNVPGIPRAKGRVRVRRLPGGHMTTYTDTATKHYEGSVAWHAAAVAKGVKLAPAGVPVRVDVLAQYPRPQRLAKAPGQLPKCVKTHGDLDNHVKAVLDGLNQSGIWGDDSQVQCLRAEAVYAALGQRPQSSIRVYIPVGFATHLNRQTKDKPRDILETSAPGIDTGPADAQVDKGPPST